MIDDSSLNLSYLFETLYPYKGSIELERWHDSLAQIEYRLALRLPVPYRMINGAVFSAEKLFPAITDPTLSEEEVREQRERDARMTNFTESEREEYFEKLSLDFREQVLSMSEEEERRLDEENDAVWNAPLDSEKVKAFLEQSYRSLAPLIKSLRPNVSLLEDVLIKFHRGKHSPQLYRAFHGFFLAWDILRVEHEGELPYKIAFTKNALADLEEILGPEADQIILGIGGDEENDDLPPERRQLALAGLKRAVHFEIIPSSVARSLIKTLP